MKTQILVLFFLFFTVVIYSQEKQIIEGRISSGKSVLSDVIVELKIGPLSKFAVSNKSGDYKFEYVSKDSVLVKVNSSGYKEYSFRMEDTKKIIRVDINLVAVDPEMLNEVIIESESKTVNKAKKTVYQIDQKDFVKNAKAGEVLRTVPNIYYNEFEGGIIVDGNLKGMIFIDGLEAMTGEVNSIKAEDIKSIEVINNPSAAYFKSDFLGAIVNVITKKSVEEFIKGSLGGTLGLKNNFWALSPRLSYKKGIFIIKSNFDYLSNDQRIDFVSNRVDADGSFFQSNTNYSRNKQLNSNTRIGLNFNEKTSLAVTGSLYQYNFDGNGDGFTILDDNAPEYFFKNGTQGMKTWGVSSVFNYKIRENNAFYIKSAYFVYGNKDISEFTYDDGNSAFYNIRSKNKELTLQANYEVEKISFLDKKMDFYSDLKYINRRFDFSNQSFFINQNIIDASAELDTDWSDRFSTELSLTFENTNNFNNTTNQNYSLLLPTFNSVYHFKNKIDLKFGYSRKVLRPSASDLNDQILIIYPGVATQGNAELNPQLRNYYFLTFNKIFKSDNFSFKVYNESINNAITSVYRKEENLLIQTLDNAAKYNSTGVNVGFRTKLLKKVMANLNSGFDYNVYEDNSENAVIEKNAGFTFRGSVNLSSKFFKDKMSVSFSGRQDGPTYSLLAKRTTRPYLDLTVATNVLKDKLNISLYVRNLLGEPATASTSVSSYDNFYQRIETRNNTTNLSLTLTYNFGKKFNDKIDSQDINNDDVRR
ncbi:TonB-dependent receptor [Flavobacterium sp. Fl-318]|uniref:TonB-dependent receptor n=1 Tax=Flavobacterium cupriresistens TaxID=2893885 RepID=A0ABU4REU7_9FLAO|nr:MULTISPECIES: outer membrane beta-barrel protein [unclassified Flavobacterium]MDX6189985.1 TonB-dependent receptor [Flavobacterium sp. Fl-318]UFH42810.1 TonB-dependent receptor [Flavobacterium sp. F-323]